MEIIFKNSLSEKERDQALELCRLCCQHDGQKLSLPEDGDNYFLLYESKDVLAAVLCLSRQQPALWECTAFTLPSCRRKGYFSMLFDQALEESAKEEEPPSIFFMVHSFVDDTAETLKAMEAELWYEEYMMEMETASFTLPKTSSDYTVFPEQGMVDGMFSLVSDNGQKIGRFFLADSGSGSVYFYGFEILEELRFQGIGTACFPYILAFLKEQGYEKVLLQVSGQNLPALSLYKKTGFRMTETLSCFIYY